MLSILRRGTVLIGGTSFEFHGDNDNSRIFYVTPQPQFVMNGDLPAIELVTYQTSDATNGSGYALLQVELGVPEAALGPIAAEINTLFGVSDPIFQTLAVQSGTIVQVTYPDGEGGTTGVQVTASDFASNRAIAQLELSAKQMTEVKKVMEGGGSSPFQIQYSVVVPSFMPAVTVELSFDSSIAFEYEVTSHAHKKWAHKTQYTYDISKQLTASNASKITINKIDPTISEDVIDHLRSWAQSVIEARVAEEVNKQIALLSTSGGLQSFSVRDLSSFSETYAENQTVMWRVRPTATLPSFGQLGLSRTEWETLEQDVDVRQFVMKLIPNVKFKSDALAPSLAAGGNIHPGKNPFMDLIQPLKSLDVTIDYPTLDGSEHRTVNLTSDKPHVWSAKWDDKAGGQYTLNYIATYADGTTIKGSLNNLTESIYTLTLADVGTLNVTFNADKFFGLAGGGGGGAGAGVSGGIADVESLIISAVFEVPGEAPIPQTFTLDKQSPVHTVSSLRKAPLATSYAYTITYYFKPDTKANPYTSNVRTDNQQFVDISGPDMTKSIPILVDMGSGTAADPKVVSLTADFYYDGTPVFPDIKASKALPKPTQSSPVQFNFSPEGKKTFQSVNLDVFAASNLSPLTLSASGFTADGDTLTWGPVQFDPLAIPSMMFMAKKPFTIVEMDPAIVDWKTGPTGAADTLKYISVRIASASFKTSSPESQVTIHPSSPDQKIGFDQQQGCAPSAFVRLAQLEPGFFDLSFDWVAEYVYEKAGVVEVKGTADGTSMTLPKSAAPAKAAPALAPAGA
ncbi:hypothetical protein [Maricaulis sp.]|uniref:hypothetical protein n=1 Tax=Maricaulis sp. TaxID=1486257 RepID=UPI0026028E21|nr:hypothetical protein [Maricaulis sp.]